MCKLFLRKPALLWLNIIVYYTKLYMTKPNWLQNQIESNHVGYFIYTDWQSVKSGIINLIVCMYNIVTTKRLNISPLRNICIASYHIYLTLVPLERVTKYCWVWWAFNLTGDIVLLAQSIIPHFIRSVISFHFYERGDFQFTSRLPLPISYNDQVNG